MNEPVDDDDLQHWVDGRLDPRRRAALDAWLAARPAEAARVAAYRRHNQSLHALFDPMLHEQVPEALRRRPRPALRWYYAAVVAWVAFGALLGWTLRGVQLPLGPPPAATAWTERAAVAHTVYAPEVAHPVEVGAEAQAHLVAWLSKRLGRAVKAPDLAALGYTLMGGRLLPGAGGPAAQFMYENGRGGRLTLYVTAPEGRTGDTTFRYERRGGVGLLYWVDGELGYALAGENDRGRLLAAAHLAYRALDS